MRAEARKPFGWSHGWGSEYWVQWATIAEMLRRLAIPSGASVLDVGCGVGWTTLLLAESGYDALGVDLVPVNVEVARERAERWGLAERSRFEVADMERLALGARAFDAVLVFDALHHASRQADVVAGVARHLRPGGWAMFGEPSFLHLISPHARRTAREHGWREGAVRVRRLRRDCARAGLGAFRRFHQPTLPYESPVREFAWQLVRLVSANVVAAPGVHQWLAARKMGG
jgi:SAM-dependent methyltransferase